MRIITLWEPYATLLASGLKRYETRHWVTHYRGPLLIHAAQRKPTSLEMFAFKRFLGFTPETNLGCVVAIARLDGCLKMVPFSDQAPAPGEICIEAQSTQELFLGGWEPGRYAWDTKVLTRLIEPIPWKGQQGIKPVPDELRSLIYQELGDHG